MLQKTSGIVLRTINYSETSVICDIYTLELGLCTFIVNGVRKKKPSISPALLRVMSILDLVIYYKVSKDIQRIKEAKTAYMYHQLPYDVVRGTIGLFLTEVIRKSIREKETNIPLYNFIISSFETMDTATSIHNFPAWFLVHFARHIGISPQLNAATDTSFFDFSTGNMCVEEPIEHPYFFSMENSSILQSLATQAYPEAENAAMRTQARRSFIDDMLRYYKYHIANFGDLKSVDVLQSVFS